MGLDGESLADGLLGVPPQSFLVSHGHHIPESRYSRMAARSWSCSASQDPAVFTCLANQNRTRARRGNEPGCPNG